MENVNYQKVADKLNEIYDKRANRNFFVRVAPVMPVIDKISKNIKISDVDLKKVDLNLGKMQSLALDFFYDLSPDFEDRIATVLEDIKGTVLYVSKPSENGGNNSVGLFKGKREIQLRPKNNTNGLIVVAHELAHCAAQRIQEKKVPKTDCIGEIESLFVEKLYTDWLLKNRKISKDEHKKVVQHRENCFARHLRIILEGDDLLRHATEVDKQGGRVFTPESLKGYEEELGDSQKAKNLKNRIGIFMKDESNKRNNYFEYYFRYVMGEIVAQALYEDYKKNPQQTMERFEKFLNHNAEYQFYRDFLGKDMLDKEEVDKCFGTLLGNDYERKIDSVCKKYTEKVDDKEKE